MTFKEKYRSSVEWLLEPGDIGVKYLAMRDLLEAEGGELAAVKEQAHTEGPISDVLSNMQPEGFWEQPGHGYYPKYTGTVWSIILLAQLGASVHADARLTRACSYVLKHNLSAGGQFTVNGLPSGTADCLQGNLLASLLDLGCTDARLDKAFEWMARSVTGDGVAPMGTKQAPLRYYSGKIGPGFRCGANNKLPCAWGAVKVMSAFARLPATRRTCLIDAAIQQGVSFLLDNDPSRAEYPCGYNAKPSGNWWKFGFPVFYVTDILQVAEALVGLGFDTDPSLRPALDLIRDKQDASQRWCLEYSYAGKTWGDYGRKNQPNKWVTLRALRVLQSAGCT